MNSSSLAQLGMTAKTDANSRSIATLGMTGDRDEGLMLAYASGEAAAFDVLYARHKGGVYRYVLRHCGNAGLADELFQAASQPVVILDVRTDRSYNASGYQARGATRLPPDHIAERAEELRLPREAWLIGFCA